MQSSNSTIRVNGKQILIKFRSDAGAAPSIAQLRFICTNNLGSLPIVVFYAAQSLHEKSGGRHKDEVKKGRVIDNKCNTILTVF